MPVTVPVDYAYTAASSFFSGGVTSSGSSLSGFSSVGARVVFTVNASDAGARPVNLSYTNGASTSTTLNVYVNGVYATTTTLAPTTAASKKQETLTLRAGINTITYQVDPGNSGTASIDAVNVQGGAALAVRGATLAYQTYEAESGTSNVVASAASARYLTAEAESSGRQNVNLTATGHYVEWVAQKAANTLTVRYSMPDAELGGGTGNTLSLYVNGVKVRSLPLSSRYAWVYGDYPFNNTPSNGNAHRFFDDSSFTGLSIPQGATVRLQKDAADTAAFYRIDLVDLEQADATYAMPANFVAVTNYGAIADDGIDDTGAINSAISDAKAKGKSGVWLPAGTFNINAQIAVSEIRVIGAGMWHTVLQGSGGKGGFRGAGKNVTIADLAIRSDATVRNDSADNPALEGNFGTGSLVQNIWVEHMKVGLWTGAGTDGLYLVNGRIRNTWADGINLAGGVINTTVSQFNLRNTGDDAMAMWSDGSANVNNTFSFNTAQLPILANTYAIYGGKDNKILDNIGADTVTSAAGIAISSRFSPSAFAGTTEVRRNTLTRTGSYEYGWNSPIGALWIYADTSDITAPVIVDNLTINASNYEGMLVSYNRVISNLTLNNVQINNAGTWGMNFTSVTGTGDFTGVQVTGSKSGALNNPNSLYTIVRGSGNSGW